MKFGKSFEEVSLKIRFLRMNLVKLVGTLWCGFKWSELSAWLDRPKDRLILRSTALRFFSRFPA
jgi:hypothetical protein